MNIISPLINRPLVKKLAKQAVIKAVDRVWENNNDKLMKKIEEV